jgi:hypothetical protein
MFADRSLTLSSEVIADSTALELLLAQSSKTDWHAYVKPRAPVTPWTAVARTAVV